MCYRKITPRTSLKVFEGLEMTARPTFVYVFKQRCPWCDAMRSEWRLFTKICTSFCDTLEVDSGAISRLLQKCPVRASKLFSRVKMYPFLELQMPDGKHYVYAGSRDAISMKKFVVSKLLT